jgi:hypothetical protein
MSGSLNKKSKQLCKVEELSGNNPGEIEDEINNKLGDGWTLHSTVSKGNNVYLIFIR